MGRGIEEAQLPKSSEDGTSMEIELDFKQDTLENYANFSKQGHALLMGEVQSAMERLKEVSYTEACLSEALDHLLKAQLPLYRYVMYLYIGK